jgi:hypothetical protein
VGRADNDDDFMFREPRVTDYLLGGFVLLLGAIGSACEFIIPWVLDEPGSSPRPMLPFYFMVAIGPALGLLAITIALTTWNSFRKVRPETTPKKMLSAGVVFACVPLFVGLGALFLYGLNAE